MRQSKMAAVQKITLDLSFIVLINEYRDKAYGTWKEHASTRLFILYEMVLVTEQLQTWWWHVHICDYSWRI
jgi:hypothetical protein